MQKNPLEKKKKKKQRIGKKVGEGNSTLVPGTILSLHLAGPFRLLYLPRLPRYAPFGPLPT